MKKEILIGEFKASLPFEFKDMELLKKVFIHQSFLNERAGMRLADRESNERLEFLGDAVLQNAISHLLYMRNPGVPEGELTRLRSRLVNRTTLAKLAKTISLDEYLLLGKGEQDGGGRENKTILAGVLEALLAAVYLEKGFTTALSYIEGLFSPLMDSAHIEPGHFDFKPMLQELAQKLFKEAPSYRLVKEEGPAHSRVFEVEALIAGRVVGKGTATKKKEAEQIAAHDALEKLESERAVRGKDSAKDVW